MKNYIQCVQCWRAVTLVDGAPPKGWVAETYETSVTMQVGDEAPRTKTARLTDYRCGACVRAGIPF